MEEKEKGQIATRERKKKREIIEESHHRVDIPTDNEEEKKALEQTGEDATSGW